MLRKPTVHSIKKFLFNCNSMPQMMFGVHLYCSMKFIDSIANKRLHCSVKEVKRIKKVTHILIFKGCFRQLLKYQEVILFCFPFIKCKYRHFVKSFIKYFIEDYSRFSLRREMFDNILKVPFLKVY